MTWLILVVLALLVLAAIAGRLKRHKGSLADYPYQKRSALFSPAERSFLGIVDQAVGDQYRVFGKVRIADVVEPTQGLDASRRQKAFNRISAKHLDFLVCAKGDLSVICAIELDDRSHRQRKRRDRDAFVENRRSPSPERRTAIRRGSGELYDRRDGQDRKSEGD